MYCFELLFSLVGSECVFSIHFTMLENEEEGGAVEVFSMFQFTPKPGTQGVSRQAIPMLATTLIIIYHAFFF